MRILLLIVFTLVSIFSQAQTSDEKIRAEIFQRAETFYANEQYSQAADLLDRLSVLKVPYDFKSIYLKIKALSNVYNTSGKYFSMMESSISTYVTMSKSSENAKKAEELSGIIENFRNSKNAESIAYEKARNGSLKDKEDFLREFPSSVHTDEIKETKNEATIQNKKIYIAELEKEAKIAKAKSMKPSVTAAVGLLIGVGGIVGLFLEVTKDNPSGTRIGISAGATIVGATMYFTGLSKSRKVYKKYEEIINKIQQEKKRVVYVSPYLNHSAGIRLGMKF